MLSQTTFRRGAPSYTRALLSDRHIYNTPIELLAMLCRLEAASPSAASVRIEDQVLLESGSTGELLSFKLAMPSHVTLSHYHLSVLSPLGQAVYGRKTGDVFHISLRGQKLRFRLLHIHKNSHRKEDRSHEVR